MPGRGAGGTSESLRSAPGGWAVGVGFGERAVAVGSEGEAGSGREAKVRACDGTGLANGASPFGCLPCL
jgi:hypothetical protein